MKIQNGGDIPPGAVENATTDTASPSLNSDSTTVAGNIDVDAGNECAKNSGNSAESAIIDTLKDPESNVNNSTDLDTSVQIQILETEVSKKSTALPSNVNNNGEENNEAVANSAAGELNTESSEKIEETVDSETNSSKKFETEDQKNDTAASEKLVETQELTSEVETEEIPKNSESNELVKSVDQTSESIKNSITESSKVGFGKF